METKRRKIIFVTPHYHCGVVEVAGTWPPLGFVYLGAQAKKAGWDVEVYDVMSLRHKKKQIMQHFKDNPFDIMATTAITPTYLDALELCEFAKEVYPECTTLMGGVHPTFSYKEIFETENIPLDYIIAGEGEIALFEFLKNFEDKKLRHKTPSLFFKEDGKIKLNPLLPLVEDLDTLEVDFSLLDWSIYKYHVIDNSRLGAISTSRGCSFGCTFCSQQKFWNKTWRGRKPEAILAELEYLNKTYDINVFLFTDEYPTLEQDRWEKLLDLIIASPMEIYILIETRVEDIVRDEHFMWKYRKAGIVHVYVGAEATDQETLDKINKEITVDESKRAIELIAEHDMLSETSFVLGFPEETLESIEKTFQLAKEFNPDFAHFLAITPWPYSDFYQDVKDKIEIYDYRQYNLIEPIIKPDNMTLRDIDLAIINCYRKFYMPKMAGFYSVKDEFKRTYLIKSMKLIMKSSFLIKKFAKLGINPVEMMEKMFKKGKGKHPKEMPPGMPPHNHGE